MLSSQSTKTPEKIIKSLWIPIPFYVKLEIQVFPEHYKTLMKETEDK